MSYEFNYIRDELDRLESLMCDTSSAAEKFIIHKEVEHLMKSSAEGAAEDAQLTLVNALLEIRRL